MTSDVWRELEIPDHQLTTTLATLTYRDLDGGLRWPRYLVEAVLFTIVGFAFGHAVGVEYAGVVSLFLGSAGLSSRFKQLVRRGGRVGGGRGLRTRLANAGRALIATTPLAAGMFLAYFGLCVLLGAQGVEDRFGFAMTAARVDEQGLEVARFRGSYGMLGHNLLVLLSAFLLAFVYRGFGALLTLTWNASAWAVALYFLLGSGATVGVHPAARVLVAVAAIAPHLVLEAIAYLAGALAGMRAGIDFGRRRADLTGMALLAGIGCGLVVVGWLVEVTWPAFVLGMLEGSTPGK